MAGLSGIKGSERRANASVPLRARLVGHLVLRFHLADMRGPYLFVACVVDDGFLDHLHAVRHLRLGAAGLRVELQGELGKVAHHEIEYLVEQLTFDAIDFRVFQDQLAIYDEREHFAGSEQEVDVLGLFLCRRRLHGHLLEQRNLFLEDGQIGQFSAVIRDPVIVELDAAQPLGGTLIKHEAVVCAIVAFRYVRIRGREKK